MKNYFSIFDRIDVLTSSNVALMVSITASAHCLIAVSGSFRPLPVTVQTITEPSAILPALISRIAPPIEAADAGSTNTPFTSHTLGLGLVILGLS